MAYGTIYTVPSISYEGNSYELRIKQRDYTGSSSEVTGSALPYERTMQGDKDELEETIKRSKYVFQLDCETDGQFKNLFTSDWQEFKAELWRDGSLYWIGWLVADYYSEPRTAPPYTIQVEAHDGLGQLKNMDYVDAVTGAKKRGRVLLSTIISDILNRIDPGVLGIYEAVNIFESNLSTDDAVYKHIGVWTDLYSLTEVKKCHAVLESIIEIFNAELFQQDGYWYILSRGVKKSSYTRRLYDTSWTLQSSASHDPEVAITSHTAENAVFWWETPKIEMVPGWKELVVDHNLAYKGNLFEPWVRRYTIGGPDYNDYEEGDLINRAYIGDAVRGLIACPYFITMLRDTKTAIMGWTIGTFEKVTNQHFQITFDYKGKPNNAAFYIFVWDTATNTKSYLGQSGEWSTVRRVCWFPSTATDRYLQIETEEMPFDGRLHLELHVYENPGRSPISSVIIDQNAINVELKQAYLVENIEVTTIINENHNYIPDTFSVMLGDFPDFENATEIYLGGLWRYNAGSWVVTDQWFCLDNPTVLKPLIYLLSDQLGTQHQIPIQWVSGEIRGAIKPGSTIMDGSLDALFTIIRFTEDTYNDNWKVDIIEIAKEDYAVIAFKQGGRLLMKSGGRIKIKK